MLLFLVSEFCSGAAHEKPSSMTMDENEAEKSVICNDAQELTNSLHIQLFRVKAKFDEEEKSESELLKLLGVNVIQRQQLYFTDAKRISGECAIHLDDIRPSLYHFDTGIVLITTKEGLFIPPTKKYYPRPVIGINDAHPKIAQRKFVEAVKIGWGYFVGVWEQNGKSILTYYKEMSPGEFRVHGDILESETKILIVRRFPHLDVPACTIQILIQDKNDRVVLDFTWFFPSDMD